MHIGTQNVKRGLLTLAVTTFAAMTFSMLPSASASPPNPPAPAVVINSVPLSVVAPTTPQVLFALTNSMSMDSTDDVIDDANQDLSIPAGTTHARAPSSAIMTWSGISNWNSVNPTTSPVNYSVPTGFTPPITGGVAGSSVPYTAALNTYSIPTDAYYSVGWNCIEHATVPNNASYGPIAQPNNVGIYPTMADIPAPTNPAWPSGEPWNSSGTWWYNGTTDGISGTGYYSSAPPGYYTINPPPTASTGAPQPAAAINFVPSARQKFHDGTEALAVNREAGIAPAGMGIGGNPPNVITNAIGTAPPQCGPGSHPYQACPTGGGGNPPLTKSVCDLYMYGVSYVAAGSNQYTQYADNSPSRLNIAKASIDGVIQAYGTQVDFGLMTYNVSGAGQNYYSWEYYMSGADGFTATDFSNTYQAPTYTPSAVTGAPPALTSEWVNNPCFGNPDNGDCSQIANQLAPALGVSTGTPALNALASYRFMQVAHASDDPSVNDLVLSGWAGVYKSYLGSAPAAGTTPAIPAPIPATPYPPSPPGFTLQDYNCGGSCTSPNTQVMMEYPLAAPSLGGNGTYDLYPTNSGYVPYSPQVILSFRGLPWTGTPSSNRGLLKVRVQPAVSVSTSDQQVYLQKFAPLLTPENTALPCSSPNADTATVPSTYPGATPAISYCAYYQNAIQASAMQSPIAGLLSTALNPSSWPAASAASSASISAAPSASTTCPPPKYVILITDGLPTEDMQGNNWPPPGSAAAKGYGATVAFTSTGALDSANTNNAAVTQAINEITTLNQNGIKTFVVGLGPGVNPSLNPTAAKVLTAMAIAGGTTNYFPGTNPAAVVQQLNTILNIISHLNVASVSAALNSTGLNVNSVAYQATYTGYAKPYQDWTGDLQAYSLATSNGAPNSTANWSAQCQLDISASGGTCGASGGPGTGDGWQSRVIATCGQTPDQGCGPGSGEPFRWDDLHGQMDNALRLIPGDSGITLGQERLDYLRGDTSNDQANGGPFRNRSHILGDIVDSAPLYIGAPGSPYGSLTGYNQFASNQQTRMPVLYVGANDGMLHAFNASNGKEIFAFAPNGVFSNLIKLTDPNYNNNHQFFVDGSPAAGDVRFANGDWYTVLAGGLNDGGHSIYALNVTNPSAIANASSTSTAEGALASDVLWEFTDPHLGLTYSQPAFTLTADTSSQNANPSGFLVFFGSGYNNSDQNPYVYAVNPETGAIVSKDVSQGSAPLGPINLCAAVSPDPCNHSASNGLSSVTVVNNTGMIGGPATTLYAGDLQGHLWKVDISSANPANWTVTLLFTATDASGNPQPITDTPVVSLNPQYPGTSGTVVYFGTGQYLGTPDITNTATQSFYGVLDDGVTNTMTRTDLVQQTISATSQVINGDNVTVRTITSNAVNWGAQKGWYIDLPVAGERVVTNPSLYQGKVVFTTYVPSPAASASCSTGGQSFLMVLNYATGGAFATPQIDLNNDGMLNTEDQVNGKNAVGFGVGTGFESAVPILSGSFAGKDAHGVMFGTNSTVNPLTGMYNTPKFGFGGNPIQITWTQLQ